MNLNVPSTTAVQIAALNAVKLKTNYDLVTTGNASQANDLKSGGIYTNSIWLSNNKINDSSQYVIGNIYSTEKRGSVEFSDNMYDHIDPIIYNKFMNEEADRNNKSNVSLKQPFINSTTDKNISLYRVPMLDGKFVLRKFLENDITTNNNKIDIKNLQMKMNDDIFKQQLLLNAYDIVNYSKEPIASTIYDNITYKLNNDNTFVILSTEDVYFKPNKLIIIKDKESIFKDVTESVVNIHDDYDYIIYNIST